MKQNIEKTQSPHDDALTQYQHIFLHTLNEGPNALDPDLFDGPVDRVLLGLKAHANTISHARLMALEQSFPMTLEAIGKDDFNNISREYIELDDTKKHDNSQLGYNFSNFLNTCGIQTNFCELAAIEWAWLESYNAQDAHSLTLEQLSEFDEEALLNQDVTWHPSVRLISLTDTIAPPLEELNHVTENPVRMLIVRPDVDVKLLPLDALTHKILKEAKNIIPLGNLLSIATETKDTDNPLQPLLNIIGSGALICFGSNNIRSKD